MIGISDDFGDWANQSAYRTCPLKAQILKIFDFILSCWNKLSNAGSFKSDLYSELQNALTPLHHWPQTLSGYGPLWQLPIRWSRADIWADVDLRTNAEWRDLCKEGTMGIDFLGAYSSVYLPKESNPGITFRTMGLVNSSPITMLITCPNWMIRVRNGCKKLFSKMFFQNTTCT